MTEPKNIVDPSVLRMLLEYDAQTGDLRWKPRSGDYFKDGAMSAKSKHKSWSSRFSGMKAFTAINSAGYLCSRVNGANLVAHRVAWVIHFGEWPSGHIDHINGIRTDNRISNLRDVQRSDNSKNRRPNRGKKSGLPHGVTCRHGWQYLARIRKDGVSHLIGVFTTPEEAKAAYDAALPSFGFHENHGLSKERDAI